MNKSIAKYNHARPPMLSSRSQDSLFSTCPVVLGLDGGRVTRAASPCPGPTLTSAPASCLSLATITGGIGWDHAGGSLWPTPLSCTWLQQPGLSSLPITELQYHRVSGLLYFIKRHVYPAPCFTHGIVMCQNTQEQRGSWPCLRSSTPPLHVNDIPFLQTDTLECYSWHGF